MSIRKHFSAAVPHSKKELTSLVGSGTQSKDKPGRCGIPIRRNNVAAWRDVGNQRHYFKSKCEANYARYLEFLKQQREIKGWEYEPETFWFLKIQRGVRSYKPDFRITRNDGSIYYVETKGYMDAQSKTKLKRMRIYHPAVELVLVDSKAYKAIARTAAKLIKGWE